MYGDKSCLFHKDSSVAKKMKTWIEEELRRSQYHGCTDACKKKNNVYNINMQPKGKATDAMPLSQSSGGARSVPVRPDNPENPGNLRQTMPTQEEHTMIQCEMMR